MLENINTANPFVCAGILIVALILVLAVFVRCDKKFGAIFQVSVYYGIILMFVLHVHNKSLRAEYKGSAEDDNIDGIMKIAHGENKVGHDIYDIQAS